MDHRPLTVLFGPKSEVLALAASHLQWWMVLFLSYEYTHVILDLPKLTLMQMASPANHCQHKMIMSACLKYQCSM